MGMGAGTGVPPVLPGAAPVAVVDPATRYAAQLQQLEDMGFADRERNLQVSGWSFLEAGGVGRVLVLGGATDVTDASVSTCVCCY